MANEKKETFKIWETLQSPSTFFDFSWEGKKGRFLLKLWSAFLALWFISNLFWPFPWFGLFFAAFAAIHAISFGTLKYFYRRMQELNDDLVGRNVFVKARYFYRNTCQTSVNVWFPLFFILSFGIGGCVLYTNARLMLTFILFLLYFVVMVYFSMVIYLQYIRFFWYLRLAAHDNESLSELIRPGTLSGKLQVQWLQDINDIACVMRYMFASVGLLYIAAFALFCFSPAYGASVTAPVFYFLWTLIAIFVVFVFIVINFLNSTHLKRLRDRVKQAYVNELILLDESPKDESSHELCELVALFRQMCAATILNSNDFPVRNASDWVLSAGITAIQVVASVATLYQFQLP